MGYAVGNASFGTTGNKTVVTALSGDPTWVRATMGARANTTETGEIFSYGVFDGSVVRSRALAPGVAKAWSYTSESSYLIVGYNVAGTKVFSATMQATPFGNTGGVGEIYINVDVANSSYPVTFEVGN